MALLFELLCIISRQCNGRRTHHFADSYFRKYMSTLTPTFKHWFIYGAPFISKRCTVFPQIAGYDNKYIGESRKLPPRSVTKGRDSDETQCPLPRKTVRHGQKKIAPIRLVRPNKTSLVAGTGIEPVTS